MQCVDASVAAKWIFPEERSQQALALLSDCIRRRERIVAPPLLPVEVVNTIRQRMRRAGLSREDAKEALSTFLAIPVTVAPDAPAALARLHHRALDLADRYRLPAAYDAYYLALAELRGCTLWTDDRRLVTSLDDRSPDVRLIGDYERM
jgi:predicted nucleic acid-binding protein